jgi:hypothetical protein
MLGVESNKMLLGRELRQNLLQRRFEPCSTQCRSLTLWSVSRLGRCAICFLWYSALVLPARSNCFVLPTGECRVHTAAGPGTPKRYVNLQEANYSIRSAMDRALAGRG